MQKYRKLKRRRKTCLEMLVIYLMKKCKCLYKQEFFRGRGKKAEIIRRKFNFSYHDVINKLTRQEKQELQLTYLNTVKNSKKRKRYKNKRIKRRNRNKKRKSIKQYERDKYLRDKELSPSRKGSMEKNGRKNKNRLYYKYVDQLKTAEE